MKISPVSAPAVMPNTSPSPDRLASAKAVAEGGVPFTMAPSETPVDPQVAKAQAAIRRIKLNTNASPDRALEEPPVEEPSVILENNEALEETKPLSPQFAALAKQRRALQQERQLFDQEKAQLKHSSTDADLAARLKSNTLSVLQEQGALTPEFYNSFTEFLVSGQSGQNPEIAALKDEIKALKEGVDKNFIDRDEAAEQQVLSQMRREAEMLAKEGDTFELIRGNNAVPKVIDLIHRTYKASGEVLDVEQAMQLVEDDLLEEHLRAASYGKIQSRLQAQQPAPLQSQPQKQLRTLTNRDTAQPPADRRTRAMMAAMGQLKRG